MKNITQSMLKTVKLIESKPYMFMTEVNFVTLKNLLVGYLLGIEETTGILFNYKLNIWLNERYARQSSLFWTQNILHLLANGDQEKAYQLLLDNLKYFLEDNTNNLEVSEE